jgi:hypothetical protein
VGRPERWIVAIPAKNEAERITDALHALDAAAAQAAREVRVLVLANNCSDDTAKLAGSFVARHRLHLEVRDHVLPPHLAHAGGARRSAVDTAMTLFDVTGRDLLLSTDADARLKPDTFCQMERAFDRGADLVLAKFETVHDALVRQLVETLRLQRIPSPPLHDDYGAAGIAARVCAYHGLGGFQSVPFNEDKNFVGAADRAHYNVNRQSGAVIEVLARANGRAAGGMAAELRNCAVAAAGGVTCLVERHELTVRRLFQNPCHSRAFAETITEWEPVDQAIAGLNSVIARVATGAESFPGFRK